MSGQDEGLVETTVESPRPDSVLHCMVLHVMVLYGTAWYCMVLHGMVWYGIRCCMVWYGVDSLVRYGMVWCCMVWMAWYGMVTGQPLAVMALETR